MAIGYLRMHEQVLSRACFCDVVASANESFSRIDFYKVGHPRCFLTVIFTNNVWSVSYYIGDVIWAEFEVLSELIKFICLSEFSINLENNYPYLKFDK